MIEFNFSVPHANTLEGKKQSCCKTELSNAIYEVTCIFVVVDFNFSK